MNDAKIPDFNEEDMDTILAEDIDFTGELSFKKPLMIKGRFSGEIKASSDLFVGDQAVVVAKVEAGQVSSKGRIKGDVYARRRIELFSTASMEGDLATPDLVIESGCRFNGICSMVTGDAAGTEPASQPTVANNEGAPAGD